ncbi:ABC transporter ATP-binding protein [Mesorhizobium sp. ANAO-SY3R2]|uniref:ABC transporter ATP-binding protein n=1 Tax=Mesorhizobium sp. ANAO-SY3R2 TaxID=3166644 RepID=UPI00366D7BF1
MDAADNIIEIRDLSVRLPDKADRALAVNKLNLTIAPGETVCIIGESGSGKSVTAGAIMGLLPAGQLTVVGGNIRVMGKDILHLSPSKIRKMRGVDMAMIFQEPATALNPVLTVGAQIDEMLEIHTTLSGAERKKKVIGLLDAVGLPDPVGIYHRYPHQMSGGQRQRVMIAMALVLNPPLLIADEPTTALDVTTQAQILRLLRELQKERNTGILMITHDFGVVADVADRVLVMRRGEVVETGTVDEVLRAPKHPYTQMLVAAVPDMVPKCAPVPDSIPVALSVRGVSKVYGRGGFLSSAKGFFAVDDVSLEVRRGQTIGIVGESGSGKSTFARCIARLVDPTAGEIRFGGKDIASLSTRAMREYRRQIQVVFQDPYRSLNPRMTVGASIIEGPMNYGVSREEAMDRARNLMEIVGLNAEALNRLPHQFSGGQRQRICIARALAMEPAILIADEAVSALDVSVQSQVLKLFKDVQARYSLTTLFITHDLRVAAQICDEIMVMQRGKLVERGPTEQVFSQPTAEYTRSLLDAVPGNAAQAN